MRCVHCGEPVDPKQERCFACGQYARRRARHAPKPLDPRVLLFGGLALIVVVAGLLYGALASRPGRTSTAAKRPSRSAQSGRTRTAARDTTSAPVDPSKANRIQTRANRIQERYEEIRARTVTAAPTPEQTRLMTQIQDELQKMRSLAMALSGQRTNREQDSLEKAAARLEREINSLVSQFARAPKAR